MGSEMDLNLFKTYAMFCSLIFPLLQLIECLVFWRSKASEVLYSAIDGLQLGGNDGAPSACFGSETINTEVFSPKTRSLSLSSCWLHFIYHSAVLCPDTGDACNSIFW